MFRQITICTSLLLFAGPAVAQDIAAEEIEKRLQEKKKAEGKDGWKVKGNLGFTGSYISSKNFVGSSDGYTVQLGLLLGLAADWKSGQHGWENELKVQHAQTRTPQLERFVKSADQLDLQSTYLYSFNEPDWLGVFGRFKLVTQVLQTDSIQPDPVIYSVDGVQDTDAAGNAFTTAAGGRRKLTGPLEPMTIRESVGAFAKPYKGDDLTLKLTAGLAAQHTITRDGLVVAGEDASGPVRIVQLKMLESTNDFGIEITGSAKGVIVKDLLSWKLSLDLFQPVLPGRTNDPGTAEIDRVPTGLGRLNADLLAGLSLKLAKWLSVDYQLTLRRQPAILQEWQVQNQILLTAGFDII